MTRRQALMSAVAVAACTVVLAAGILTRAPRVKAHEDDEGDSSRIERGFAIAPVQLNLQGKNRELVGLGSYLVNAVGDCNGCHSAGPATEYLPTGNPYWGSTVTHINTATYLGGGRDFGPFVNLPHLYSRNLTPDKTGMAEGGHTFKEFLTIMRTGVDMDQVHPNLAPPFDGNLLQVMPWPVHRNMSTHDLRAIYEYLSAIPCIEGPPAPNVLHNDCK